MTEANNQCSPFILGKIISQCSPLEFGIKVISHHWHLINPIDKVSLLASVWQKHHPYLVPSFPQIDLNSGDSVDGVAKLDRYRDVSILKFLELWPFF